MEKPIFCGRFPSRLFETMESIAREERFPMEAEIETVKLFKARYKCYFRTSNEIEKVVAKVVFTVTRSFPSLHFVSALFEVNSKLLPNMNIELLHRI